jgi:hypothetical protein
VKKTTSARIQTTHAPMYQRVVVLLLIPEERVPVSLDRLQNQATA